MSKATFGRSPVSRWYQRRGPWLSLLVIADLSLMMQPCMSGMRVKKGLTSITGGKEPGEGSFPSESCQPLECDSSSTN